MNLLTFVVVAFMPIFGHVRAEFPALFGLPTPAPGPEATTQIVNGPIQRLLVCQAIDSTVELQKLASAVAAMDQQIQQSVSSGKEKDKSFLSFDKFKEVVTTMMTTLATETTTPSYGQDGNVGYPKYFFANMSGGDNGYNGNLFPMEIDAWYQPGYSQSSYSSYSRPRPRPRIRPRPRVRPSYRKYGARRPAVMQPVQGKPLPRKPLLNRGRFAARSIEGEPEYVDDPFASLLEPLRPAIRQFLSIAREEEELLDNELDYVDIEEEDHHQPDTRGIRKATEQQSNASLKDNRDRYANPTN